MKRNWKLGQNTPVEGKSLYIFKSLIMHHSSLLGLFNPKISRNRISLGQNQEMFINFHIKISPKVCIFCIKTWIKLCKIIITKPIKPKFAKKSNFGYEIFALSHLYGRLLKLHWKNLRYNHDKQCLCKISKWVI